MCGDRASIRARRHARDGVVDPVAQEALHLLGWYPFKGGVPTERMTCVRKGSLVEMCDVDDNVWMQTIETILPGDTIRDPVDGHAVTVVTTLAQKTGGLWPIAQYMGLTADLAQLVYISGRGWVMAGEVGTHSIQLCPSIYAMVVSNGKTACVDGVTCCVHTPTDLT